MRNRCFQIVIFSSLLIPFLLQSLDITHIWHASSFFFVFFLLIILLFELIHTNHAFFLFFSTSGFVMFAENKNLQHFKNVYGFWPKDLGLEGRRKMCSIISWYCFHSDLLALIYCAHHEIIFMQCSKSEKKCW